MAGAYHHARPRDFRRPGRLQVTKGSVLTIDTGPRFLSLTAMPRRLRVEYPGAIYHLLNRGDRREPIFRSEKDRELFLQTLGQACAKTDWQVHSFCLMRNHFHLVVETSKPNLVAGMRCPQHVHRAV